MATRDAQDILDVRQSDVGRPKKKAPKQKIVRPAHIPKEVWLLETQGDRAPPVSLTAPQPKKPKFTRKVKPWEWQAFTHPNRADGLVLHHWRQRNINPLENQENGPATPAEGPAGESGQDRLVKSEPQPDNVWAKYNVKVDVPKYSDDEYMSRLQSDEWSREETDYLMGLVEDFDLRWIVIGDRYEFRPGIQASKDDNPMATVPIAKTRTMEEMKARYYYIAATMMDLRTGLSNMTPAEFKLHEKMLEFDPTKETRRKKMAEQLLKRTDDEIEEEKRLLIELKRIIQEEDDFIRERTELFERLNAPASRHSISEFESSQGLMTLMQKLMSQDRARSRSAAMTQRRAIAGLEEPKDKSNSPATPTAASGRGMDSRKSLDSTAGNERRKDSKSGHGHTPSFVQRKLSKHEEEKYGVERPEKLLTGEKIRHLRVEKRVTARASSVAAKVQDGMVELSIPIKPIMATRAIVAGYEDLCSKLDTLLEYRRHHERMENEIKVFKAKLGITDDTGKEGEGEEGKDDKGESGEAKAGDGKAEEAKAENGDKQLIKDDSKADTKVDAKVEDKGKKQRNENGDDHPDDEATPRQKSGDDEDGAEDEEEDEAETPAVGKVNGENEDEDENENEAEDDGEGEGEGEGGAEVEVEAETGGENEEESRPSTRASAGGRKRSVSVLSSAASQKSSKRPRK